jgi:phosphoinositide-3-kinase regulatory subunit 4
VLKAVAKCLPYEVLGVSEKAVVFYRPYMKYSLYERINTRPFLLPIEKAWLAYQLLVILKEIHSLKARIR